MITEDTRHALRQAASEARALARRVQALALQDGMTKADAAKIGTIASRLHDGASGSVYLADRET